MCIRDSIYTVQRTWTNRSRLDRGTVHLRICLLYTSNVYKRQGLAFAIEFTQLFFPPRTVSQNDILAESLGGLIGILLQVRWGASVERWFLGLWQRESRTDRIQRLLHGYLLLLFTFNIMPLDLTISPIELYHKWSEGRVILIPFSGSFSHWSELLYSLIIDTLIWIPAGLLWSIRSQDSMFIICLLYTSRCV